MVKSKNYSENQIKKIFIIEKIEFLRSMMELALKTHEAEIYTVATIENNFYLLDDLTPHLIIFDVETARNQIAELKEYSSKALLVGMGSEEDKQYVEGFVKIYLIKPLEAKNIAQRMLALID